MLKRRTAIFVGTLLFCAFAWAKKAGVERVDPPFWWVGMQETTVELLLRGDALADVKSASVTAVGVEVKSLIHFPNDRFMALVLDIAPNTQAGTVEIRLKSEKATLTVPYELKPRNLAPNEQEGLNSSDFIYLIMPDRFANGDPSNDVIKSANETELNRDSLFKRHGGDLKGIQERLDYLEDLGVTALWLNPVQENDEPHESYHGYAITDHYLIDPRLGSNQDYLNLNKACEEKNIKMVMDMVYNQIGDRHYLYEELPDPNWIHRWDEFTRTQYRAPTLLDPYAAESDKKIFSDGWFDHHMPDLNQKDPHLAAYLIQNSIWWIEYARLAGFRIDTYAYCDQDFMNDLVKRIRKEYPNFGIFGETWVHGMGIQGWFAENHGIDPNHKSALPSVTDFQMHYAINDALTKEMGWTDGISRMYYTLAQDYIYKNPLDNVLFLDNHDVSRFYSVIGEDMNKFKMGLAWLMTMRGTPMMYYGTEILMKNYAAPDGLVRSDFPGGWKGDKYDKFDGSARTRQENEVFRYIQTLAQWRKENPVVQNGAMTQFIPEKGLYVYFRYDGAKTVMVAMNCSSESNAVELNRYDEHLNPFTSGKDVIDGERVLLIKDWTMEPWTVKVVEFER